MKHKHFLPRVAKLEALALKFVVSGFVPKAKTTSSIRLALENEITIMIVTKKKAGTINTWKPMWEEKNQGMKIVQSVLNNVTDIWQIWCRFPPPRVREIRLHYSDSTMRQLFVGLPLLKASLPPPYASMPPLTTMYIKGEMTIERRLVHTTANGIKWMSSSELDLMSAIVLFDGRFHDLCLIMPSCLCDSMAIAFAKFVEYQRALKMVKLGQTEKLDPMKLAKAIMDRLHASIATLAHDYCN